MEEAQQIVIQALEQAGLRLPVEAVQDLSSPTVLVAICSRALALIQGASALCPSPSFPSSMSERIRLCTEIASSIKHLGFKGDLSFHQFLYPSEEETHKLFCFLLDKISNVSDAANGHDSDVGLENNFTPSSSDGLVVDIKEGGLSRLEERINVLALENAKLTHEVMDLNQQRKSLEVENEVSSNRLEGSVKEDTLKLAAENALNSTQIEESSMLQLKSRIEENQKRFTDSRTEWESAFTKSESKKRLLVSSDFTQDDELHLKLQELENVRQKIKETMAKLQQIDEQNEVLGGEVIKSTKGPSRSSYVRRITELIKNSKKQDADIARIIGETRDLQRESNANQGRLKRTYAVVDELVFRDAKKDVACRQAYRLLTSMHESFADCYDKVFILDKVHREIAELQATLEAMEKRPVDLKSAEADFDTLVLENLSLEKTLRANMKINS